MNRLTQVAVATALTIGLITPALSEPYVDYTPQKGYWRINAIEVDPNHVDDYLTGLRRSQFSAFDVLRRHGLIDDYKLVVRDGYKGLAERTNHDSFRNDRITGRG